MFSWWLVNFKTCTKTFRRGWESIMFSNQFVSIYVYFPGYFIPPVYIPDHSEDSGMTTKQSSILIAIFGIVNTVGRVICGWIADRSWCDKIILKSGSVLVGGVATMFVSYYITFEMMALYSTVFGLSTGISHYLTKSPQEYVATNKINKSLP